MHRHQSLPSIAIAAILAYTPLAARAATETIIYDFKNQASGYLPSGPLLKSGGKFYGVTKKGGAHNLGTLYLLTQGGGHTVLHSFAGGSEGSSPNGTLLNLGGTIYGTTLNGGAGPNCPKAGCGTVFSLFPNGTFETLHMFSASEGIGPTSLTVLGGTLFGVAPMSDGGSCGTLFALTTAGGERTLHSFTCGADGSNPSTLIAVGTGLYGTTVGGGAQGFGTVFTVTSDGTETVLHDFAGKQKGEHPFNQLLAVGTALYGTAGIDCSSAGYCSAVYRLDRSGQFKILHTFDSARSEGPTGGLIALGGLLYGTTAESGGSVYAMTQRGAVSTIFVFNAPGQGARPFYSLTRPCGRIAESRA